MTLYVAAKTSLVVEKMLLESLLDETVPNNEEPSENGFCFKTPEGAIVTRGPNEAIFAITVIVEQIDPRL